MGIVPLALGPGELGGSNSASSLEGGYAGLEYAVCLDLPLLALAMAALLVASTGNRQGEEKAFYMYIYIYMYIHIYMYICMYTCI